MQTEKTKSFDLRCKNFGLNLKAPLSYAKARLLRYKAQAGRWAIFSTMNIFLP